MPSKADDDGDREDQEYEGTLITHWEGGGFDVVVGRRLFGLLRRWERWQLTSSPDVVWPAAYYRRVNFGDTGIFRLRFRGRRGPRRRCGHMGECHREATVSKVLECVRLK
jgi:hypothetical protein